ncbi:MAG: ElyC/SanA/YdcF family protein [Verrucomicrobiota bacterium]
MRLALLKKRHVYLPTFPGFLVLALFMIAAVLLFVFRILPILSPHEPQENADLLVIEGWNSDPALQQAIDLFQSAGHYDYICATGADIDKGFHLSQYKTWATFTGARLEKRGISEDRIIVAPAGPAKRHRTHASAVALREKIIALGIDASRINLYTEQTHARRSLMIYSKVFEGVAHVGVIPSPSEDFDTSHWWSSSAGAKIVIMETVACLYEWLADGGR